MEEIYKVIIGFNNYEVSSYGNVRNIKTKRVLKPHLRKDYYEIRLSVCNVSTTITLHKLVANTFLDNPNDKDCIDHIDNDKLNNNITNLRYATKSENQYNRKINKNNTSGFKGVSYHSKTQKWDANIKIDGITVHLGRFTNKEDAIEARILKANQVFGVYTNECEKLI